MTVEAGVTRRQNTSEMPNVLIVLTDQQSLWTLSCYGAVDIESSNGKEIPERFRNP